MPKSLPIPSRRLIDNLFNLALTAAGGEEVLLLAKLEHSQRILLDVSMLTARGADKDIQMSFKLGAVFHVEKPFEVADLLQKIQAALAQEHAV